MNGTTRSAWLVPGSAKGGLTGDWTLLFPVLSILSQQLAHDVKTCYPCLSLPKAGELEDLLALTDATAD